MIKSVAKDIAEIQYLPTFRFMGYDSEGLAKVIYWYENKETKMTREEAIKIVTKIYKQAPDLSNETLANVEVSTLEALGLIKFDEPELGLNEKIKLKLNNAYTINTIDSIIDMVHHLGYKITKT